MNKQTIAAVVLGAAIGVSGKAGLDALVTPAAAGVTAPVVHALDLRRAPNGNDFHFVAYASRAADAGYVDLGLPKKCHQLSDETRRQLLACMNAAGTACEW